MGRLSKECIGDISVLRIEERQDRYMEELFERWCEIKREEFEKMTEKSLRKECKDIAKEWDSDMYDLIVHELDGLNKEELIDWIIDGYDGSEAEHTDYIVNVYIDD